MIPFDPPAEFHGLRDWYRGEDATPVRLLHAPGRVGKTRLALELAASLDRFGWIAGVVGTDYAMVSFRASLKELVRADHTVFCAIDYAETNVNTVGHVPKPWPT